jgi:multidrug efflux pump subunit AcrA (membrane-fusion protein)
MKQPQLCGGDCMNTKRALQRAARYLLGACALIMLVACEEPPLVEMPVRVVTIPAAQEDVTLHGNYVGQTQASKRVEINSRVDGFLEDISFVDGSVVSENFRFHLKEDIRCSTD